MTGSRIHRVGRMSKLHGVAEAELAALVRDGFQARVGSELYATVAGLREPEGCTDPLE